ncbi:MAG: hypothetical protein WCR20_06715 [Verrucomicrobiota bacterium]
MKHYLKSMALGGFLVLSCCNPHTTQGGGHVVAWGAGRFIGPLSDDTNRGQSMVPQTLTNASLLAGGWRHSIALDSNGTLFSWGDDSLGALDFPTNNAGGYRSISCGEQHSIAISTNGTVLAAGFDLFHQTDIPAHLSKVVAIAAGFYHNLALRSDGTVVAWGGSADYSPGGDPNYGQSVVPTGLSNVVAVAAGGWHSLALRSDGTVVGWGRNDYQQVGIPPGLTNVIAIAAGAAHSLILRGDGKVLAWGLNTYGQTNIPANLSGVIRIAAGGWHNLALRTNGTVISWGAGSSGGPASVSFGQNTVPLGLSNVVQIACGLFHSLAVVASPTPSNTTGPVELLLAADRCTVGFPGEMGKVYRIQYTDSIRDLNWQALPLTTGVESRMHLTDPSPPRGQRFYRLQSW